MPTAAPTPAPGRVTSAGLTGDAWKALGDQKYDEAVKLARKCIDLFESQAVQQQQALPTPPPVGVVSAADKDQIFSSWALNDVAACYFILGQALEKLGRVDEAKEAYRGAQKFPGGRTWDLSFGGFWSPAEAATKRLAEL